MCCHLLPKHLPDFEFCSIHPIHTKVTSTLCWFSRRWKAAVWQASYLSIKLIIGGGRLVDRRPTTGCPYVACLVQTLHHASLSPNPTRGRCIAPVALCFTPDALRCYSNVNLTGTYSSRKMVVPSLDFTVVSRRRHSMLSAVITSSSNSV